MLLSVVVALLQVTAPTGVIVGTVRDDAQERPLPGVRVETGSAGGVTSDSLGHYRIVGLGAGPHRLRFSTPRYKPLELRVLLADASSETTVDVQLSDLPVQLPTLQVVAASDDPARAGEPSAELGRSALERDWVDWRQAGEVDVQRALADAPGVQGRGETAAGLHVRGGASSDNLVLLDGIPLFSAVHFSSASSAVNPDIVAGADLHAGVGSARFGDHLAGVVELETRDPGPDGFQVRGSVASTDVRQTVAGYLPGLPIGIVLGARTSVRDALMAENHQDRGNGYRDLVGVATSRIGDGRLRLVSFLAGNRLEFPSVGDADPQGAAPADAGELSTAANNTIAWDSHSQGLTWTRTGASGATLETAAWWAGSSARVGWQTARGPEQLRSDLSELGLSARVAWPRGLTVGGSFLRPSTRYEVTTAGTSSAVAPGLRLDAAPVVGSVFAERSWRPWRALRLSTGLRASTDFSGWAGIEPRVTALLDADANTRFGIGLGRSHQVVQSALNDESALGLLLGFDLPVAATAGLPVARADHLEMLASRHLAGGLDLSVSGYLRRASGLALGAASTVGFFPEDSLVVGRGNAAGVSGALELRRGPFAGSASLTVARDERTAGTTHYNASYGHGTSFAVDLGYRIQADTRLLARLQGGAQQPTSVVASGFEWTPLPSFGHSGELAGTPTNLPGAVNGARLPLYTRLDLGVRRAWHFRGFATGAELTTALSVTNVLDRQNVLGFVARPGGDLGVIRGLPRSLMFEVGWSF